MKLSGGIVNLQSLPKDFSAGFGGGVFIRYAGFKEKNQFAR